jgi:hypothetical protein
MEGTGGHIRAPFTVTPLSPAFDMSWREITVGETRWSVAPVAERVANTHAWRLVLSCRVAGDTRGAVWANTGLQSSSRSDLYAQADRLSDDKVAAAVARHLGGGSR